MISFSESFDDDGRFLIELLRRTLPLSGSAKMTTQLLLMGMFVEFVKLESPEGMCQQLQKRTHGAIQSLVAKLTF